MNSMNFVGAFYFLLSLLVVSELGAGERNWALGNDPGT